MRLLSFHGDQEAFFGVDEVVVVILAEIDLDPFDRPGETTRFVRIVGGDGGSGFVTDVGGLAAENTIGWVASIRPRPTAVPS